MNHVVFILLAYLFVSALSVENGPVVKETQRAAVKISKDFDNPPISIGETDLIIENILGIIDGITIQIENIHVNVDLQPNINVIIDIGNPIASLFDLLVRLVGAHGGPSSADVIARIEEGFKRINDRLSAFEHRLEQLFDELKLVIQLALYHPIRTDIHLLLNELHDTLQKPSPSAVTRFITKCTLNDPLDNLFRLYRLVDEKVTADLLPSISKAVEFNRTSFLKFARVFLSDGSLATLLTSACDSFSRTKPPRRQRAVFHFRSTTDSIRAHVVRTYTAENRQLLDNARAELRALVYKHSSAGSNALIAERAHAFFRAKYRYTKRNWGVLVFNRRSLENSYQSWLLRTGSGVEVVDEVAGRMAVLHVSGDDSRDGFWESRVRDAVQQVEQAYEVKDAEEVASILGEKLGNVKHGFMVLVRHELEANANSFSDVVHNRELCCRGSFPTCLPICINCCITWTFVIGKN